MALPADRICECDHWSEEHYERDGALPAGCEGCVECTGFKLDPALNTEEAIAHRGGYHQPGCVCAWCVEHPGVHDLEG